MELHQIRQFIAVTETGSFTKGASRAGVSQPAISVAVAKLEREMGQKLLDRRRGSVVPTAAGRKFLDAAREILRACHAVKSNLGDGRESPTVRMGLLRTLSSTQVIGVIRPFLDANPDVRMEFSEGSREELSRRLEQKKLDASLTSLTEADTETNSIALFREPYLIAVSPRHRFARLKSVSLGVLDGEPFVVRTSCEIYRDVAALMGSRGIRPRVVYRTEQEDRASDLVAAGIGISLLPALHGIPGIVNVRIHDFEAARTIGIRWLVNADDNESMRTFIAFARSRPWVSHIAPRHRGQRDGTYGLDSTRVRAARDLPGRADGGAVADGPKSP